MYPNLINEKLDQHFEKLVNRIPSNYWFTQFHFINRHKQIGNFFRPRSFSEYLQWKKLHDRSDAVALSCDKWRVRELVEKRLGGGVLVKLYQSCSSPEEIDYDRLPQSFVLKTSHGSGWNILVEDARCFDRSEASLILRKWLDTNYYYVLREWGYKNISPRILVEEFLKEEGRGRPRDYKFFCFHGTVLFIQVDTDRGVNHKRSLYDRGWKELNVNLEHARSKTIPPPPNLKEMVRCAETLASDWDFCRVDLYDLGDRVIFGEMTYCPGAGLERFRPWDFDLFLGSVWNKKHPVRIPEKYYKPDSH